MIFKIGVFGSAKENLDRGIYNISYEIGKEIAGKGHILITGAAKGISRFAAKGAKESNGLTVGISPTSNSKEKNNYEISFDNLDCVIHTGQGYKGRNVVSVRSCDGIVVINGGFGTLNEVTIAEGEDKPIVVIEGTGGCSDELKTLFKKINPYYKKIKFEKDVKKAFDSLIKMIKS